MVRGERLRELREQRQWTQAQLGHAVGLDGQYISKLERGVLTGMTVDVLERLCRVLGASADYLLGQDGREHR
jgi:transcriptional regulator with XRE-family HTH domain